MTEIIKQSDLRRVKSKPYESRRQGDKKKNARKKQHPPFRETPVKPKSRRLTRRDRQYIYSRVDKGRLDPESRGVEIIKGNDEPQRRYDREKGGGKPQAPGRRRLTAKRPIADNPPQERGPKSHL